MECPVKGNGADKGLEAPFFWEKVRRAGVYYLEKKQLKRDSISPHKYLKGGSKENGAVFFSVFPLIKQGTMSEKWNTWGSLWISGSTSVLHRWWNTGIGWPGVVECLSWRTLEAAWALCSVCSCFSWSRTICTYVPLPNSAILCFHVLWFVTYNGALILYHYKCFNMQELNTEVIERIYAE